MAFPKLLSQQSQFGLLGIETRCTETRWSAQPGPVVVAMESVSTKVMVRGFVAHVAATLVYHNPDSCPLQVQYVMPIDESAALYKFEAHLDGRTIVAHCMEKKKAEKVYKEAVEAGHTAVLAREHHLTSDIVCLNLGNLPGESRAELTLHLVMELKLQTDGGISFVLPTVLNPRYCPAGTNVEEGFRFGGAWHGERIAFVPNSYEIAIEAQVSGSHEIARVISHTDPLDVTIADDALSAKICQDGGFKCDHDWSLLVYYNNPYKVHVLRETADRSGTGIMKDDLLMINFFPEVPHNTYSSKNEIIFIIDRSGSMNGENMQSARATLLLFLKSLPQGCLFNVVSFGSTFSHLFPEGSQEYTEATLKEACELQSKMEANMGGTEVLEPFKSIYSKPPKAGYSRQILLISDGDVWNVDQVTELIGRHAHETRVFSVGIGSGASTALIRGVARAGRGRSEMVVQQDMLTRKVMGLVSSMVQENVQEVSVACKVEPTSRVTLVPKVPPVIFGGQHLILYARVPPTTQVQSVSVRGKVGSLSLNVVFEGQHITQVHDQEMTLHRLAARTQINQWQLDNEEDIADEMVNLSLASGVVCRHTALVGVDQESGKAIQNHSDEIMEDCMVMLETEATAGTALFGAMGPPLMPLMAPSFPNRLISANQRIQQSRQPRMAKLSSFSAEQRSKSTSCPPPPLHNLSPTRSFMAFGSKQPACEIKEKDTQEDTLNKDDLLGIVSLQKFDGSWTLEDVALLSDIPLSTLSTTNPTKDTAAWATALALALLESKFGGVRDQWELLATKARNFVASRGEDVKDLLGKAQAVIMPK